MTIKSALCFYFVAALCSFLGVMLFSISGQVMDASHAAGMSGPILLLWPVCSFTLAGALPLAMVGHVLEMATRKR